MDVALQLLIWLGSGFAFVMGLMLGVLFAGFWLEKRNKQDERATNILLARNEIGERQVQAMIAIARAIEDTHEPV